MPRPTIVLVHGAWADGPSWNAVAPDEGETVSQILSGSGSALVPDPTTVLDLAGYPGGLSRHHTLRTRRMEAPSELGGGGH